MIHGYFGMIGSGKTLGAVIQAYREYQNKNTIFSTMPLNFEHIPIKTAEDFLKCTNGILLADELWYLLDSRFSHSARNVLLSTILLRSRKQQLNVIYTEQHYTQIDVRIRRNTQFFYLSQIDPYFANLNEAEQYLANDGHFSLDQHIYSCDGVQVDHKTYSNVESFFQLYDTKLDPYLIDYQKLRASVYKALMVEKADLVDNL